MGHPGFAVTLYDSDEVSPASIGCQRFAAADVGLNKAQLLVHRLNLFYGLDWKAVPSPVVPAQAPWADLLVTAVDRAVFRADLGRAARARSTDALWLDFGNGADRGNVVLGHLGTPRDVAQRLPNVFDLYPELADMEATDKEQPSCSTEEAIRRQGWPVNRVAAMIGSELLWSLFRTGRIETHGAFFRLDPMEINPLQIDPAVWGFSGHSA